MKGLDKVLLAGGSGCRGGLVDVKAGLAVPNDRLSASDWNDSAPFSGCIDAAGTLACESQWLTLAAGDDNGCNPVRECLVHAVLRRQAVLVCEFADNRQQRGIQLDIGKRHSGFLLLRIHAWLRGKKWAEQLWILKH